jgi:hypothetical protein
VPRDGRGPVAAAGEERIEVAAPGPNEEAAGRQEHLNEEHHAQPGIELGRADRRGPDANANDNRENRERVRRMQAHGCEEASG